MMPEFLYTSDDIAWDNVDWNATPGVSKVVDLFDYPWREPGYAIPEYDDAGKMINLVPAGGLLPDNTYDYAIASHIVEHIPHHIVENGQFVHHHSDYQDGWFYWFGELNRILKPGGTAFILCPYAWSNGGISDPTHTRYITPASFNYLIPNDESAFTYRGRWGWKPIDYATDVIWNVHQLGHREVTEDLRRLNMITQHVTHNVVSMGDWSNGIPEGEENLVLYNTMMWDRAQTRINALADILTILYKVGDEDHG